MKTRLFKFLHIISTITILSSTVICSNCASKPITPSFDYLELENPTCIIKTENGSGIVDKDYYEEATITITNCDETQKLIDIKGNIKGRGHLSWTWPKKSYSIKFNEKQSVFGSTNKYKKWTLVSNYGDPSLYRNFIAYTLASKLNKLAFSPSVHMVDLYLDNTYLGVYLLTDRIEAKDGRVNIDTTIDSEGNNGYLIEQTTKERVEGFKNIDWIELDKNLCFQIKSPDTESEEYLSYASIQTAYIKNYIQNCLTVLEGSDWKQVTDLIDVDTFVDGYLIEELMCNLDCYRYSMYYYKDKDGKLCHGPIWDFDLSSGNVNFGPGSYQSHSPTCELWGLNNIFYKNLYNFQEFKTKLSNRLVEFKSSFDEVVCLLDPNNSDGYYQKSKQSLERNFKKWDILGTNKLAQTPIELRNITTLSEQLSFLKAWLESRYGFLQKQIK